MENQPWNIVILPAGWVFVGKLIDNDNETCTLTNASNVRRYYTGKGLGPLAEGGPNTDGVTLDAVPDVTFRKTTPLAYIACNEEKWQ